MNTTNNQPTVKMSKGFTMIELIFVIVIIGILAAVAIPKLASTRDDAKVTAAIKNLQTAVSDMQSYYSANGENNVTNPDGAWGIVTLDKVTATIPNDVARAIKTGAVVMNIEGETGVNCFTITESTRNRTINGNSVPQRVLTVTFGDGTDAICTTAKLVAEDKGLYSSDANNSKEFIMGGQSTTY